MSILKPIFVRIILQVLYYMINKHWKKFKDKISSQNKSLKIRFIDIDSFHK